MAKPFKSAPLQLSKYNILDYTYKCNPTAKPATPEHPVTAQVGVDYNVKSHSRDKDKFLIEMTIDLNKRPKVFKSNRYQISMRILGEYQFDKGVAEDVKTKMIIGNGTAILYGLARGVVAQFTGGVGAERFILPTVNLLAIAKNKNKQASEAKSKETQARQGLVSAP